MNTLKEIFDKHNADKGHKHKYHTVYDELWSKKRNDEINFLEVGIWKGAGLESLVDYFPNGQIYGIDIFTRIRPDEVSILEHEHVHWLNADSMSFSVTSQLRNSFDTGFDFILDDGAHYPEANRLTFKYISPFLNPGGVYIIEDVWPFERMTNEERKHPWVQKYPERYNDFENEKFLQEIEKSGLSIQRHDLRKQSGEPDSYIITLTKDLE